MCLSPFPFNRSTLFIRLIRQIRHPLFEAISIQPSILATLHLQHDMHWCANASPFLLLTLGQQTKLLDADIAI